jgi:hypothetical protein
MDLNLCSVVHSRGSGSDYTAWGWAVQAFALLSLQLALLALNVRGVCKMGLEGR